MNDMTPTPGPSWTLNQVLALFAQPFNDLLEQAHRVHRRHHDPNRLQLSSLLNIKTGGCTENCTYCGQSAWHDTATPADKLMLVEEVVAAARKAQAAGASRFCMGAAWRAPKERDMPTLLEMVEAVRGLGLETCMTLGALSEDQAQRFVDAGLDYYNHNIDTSPDYYKEIVTTHDLAERLDTLKAVRAAGIRVCSGGIIGMGESRADRAAMLETLADLDPAPESVPINLLVPIAGTPLEHQPPLDVLELIRTIAVARILMPAAFVRLSAGRATMSDEGQALCFFAGANSVFYGDRLLTTDNADTDTDRRLFAELGLTWEPGDQGT